MLIVAALALAGCAEGAKPLGFLGGGGGEGTAATSTTIVERDVEAPQVFQVSEAGLWDGRPSLGGVWVAYPGVDDPERVIIRNSSNDRFVIGALFRRERENPGPRLQVSSDAADALGMLAGQPVTLQVTALRREEAAEPAAAGAALDTAETAPTEALEPVPPAAGGTIPGAGGRTAAAPAPAPAATAPRGPATAAAAIGAPSAEAPAAAAAAPAGQPAAQPAAARPAAAAAPGGRTLLQIGIFSVEANAERAAEQIRATGAPATVRRETSQGKTFWRVVVGPVATADARAALLTRVKAMGYADAFYTSR
jgi:cell division septation protein DedD